VWEGPLTVAYPHFGDELVEQRIAQLIDRMPAEHFVDNHRKTVVVAQTIHQTIRAIYSVVPTNRCGAFRFCFSQRNTEVEL
jgi:hypothetical protein